MSTEAMVFLLIFGALAGFMVGTAFWSAVEFKKILGPILIIAAAAWVIAMGVMVAQSIQEGHDCRQEYGTCLDTTDGWIPVRVVEP